MNQYTHFIFAGEHHRDIWSALGPYNVADFSKFFLEAMPEEKQNSIERLVLRGGGDNASNRKPGKERLDILRTKRQRVRVLSVAQTQ